MSVGTQAVTQTSCARRAAVLGGTGSVGGEIVKGLLSRNWESIVLLNRRKIGNESFKNSGDVTKIHEFEIDMSKGPEEFEKSCSEILKQEEINALFIAMGVGAASKVDEETLRNVDCTLPNACAKASRQVSSVKHVSLLTAVNADANAVPATHNWGGLIPRTAAGRGLYNQIKGQIEENIYSLSFPSFSTFRPATLIGSQHTPKTFACIATVLDGLAPVKYKLSKIDVLGSAMVFDAEKKLDSMVDGVYDIFEGDKLHSLYKELQISDGVEGSEAK